MKIVRTDRELDCPRIDATLRADLILTCYTPITARVIAAAPNLRGIVKYGVGIDAIDIPAAAARDVPVVNIPDYAGNTVAEGAFALLIALTRKLGPLHLAMRADGWAWPVSRWLGTDIAGKTLGLVGVGRIGRAMARMAGTGFGARVLGCDPGLDAAAMRAAAVEPRDDLHAMLGECDFVSIHCTLNDTTRGLIGAAEFAAMRPGAILINVSRGAIVDETALLAALRSGRLGGAGLDVFTREPLDRDDHPLAPLFGMDNVILTPHLAFHTAEAMERLETETLERCREIVEGRPVLVRSTDPRLRAQTLGVRFE